MKLPISAESQFSIYKICHEKITEKLLPNSAHTPERVVHALISHVKHILSKKNNLGNVEIQYQETYGIVFKTEHIPAWRDTIVELLGKNEIENKEDFSAIFYTNTNISYVLFKIINKNVYAMTGGYGSHYIKKYSETNFGLYLLPKILDSNNPTIKSIIEKNLTTNRAASSRTNRSNTSFTTEQNLSSIYTELAVEIDKELAEEIGIRFDEDERVNKKVNLINKDSLVIRYPMNLNELNSVPELSN